VWHPEKLERLCRAIDGCAASYGLSKLIDAKGEELGQTIFDFSKVVFDGENDV
jgi:hypothetical protein